MKLNTELLKLLLSIDSSPDNKEQLNKCLDLCLTELREFKVEIFEKEGSKSALVYNTRKRPEKLGLILNGHLDIIPGKKKQYEPKISGDKMYGVGSMDMKGSIVAFIDTFKTF